MGRLSSAKAAGHRKRLYVAGPDLPGTAAALRDLILVQGKIGWCGLVIVGPVRRT